MSDETPPDATRYPSLEAWVEQYLLPTHTHRLGSETRWCASWWAHSEALERLDALWMAWEETRVQTRGSMSSWWIQHCRPHMAALTDPDGPFHRCRVNLDTGEFEHFTPKVWPTVAGPAELFIERTPD